ncbi:MAG TPA: tRNA (adenosine(37)-N6)-dimethylallyltransferase MiaA [Acholeplasmataceae bacterium]|nr:tRNA (adenosine(37)-N6)-dimethylallyltransferase MiaA [Acholeplasmataceae bacterium]
MKKVIVICGPTAVGKTAISIELAKHLNAEIISGDSVQVYKRLDIGSAKIKDEEKQGVIHHLIDIKEPNETYDVAQFQIMSRALIDEINVPMIVGGTGLYIKAVIDNYEFHAPKYDIKDESMYDSYSNEALHELLKSKDEKTANELHQNNRRRIIRAILQADSNFKRSELVKKDERLYDALVIYLTMPREQLYERINLRVDQMVNEGFVEEAFQLYQDGFLLNILGYRELNTYFDGNASLEEALIEIKKKTRHLAKRQETWFKHQMNADIVTVKHDDLNQTIEALKIKCDQFLKE